MVCQYAIATNQEILLLTIHLYLCITIHHQRSLPDPGLGGRYVWEACFMNLNLSHSWFFIFDFFCSHQEYIVDGVNLMRVKFHVAGSRRKGTVHVNIKGVSCLHQSIFFGFSSMKPTRSLAPWPLLRPILLKISISFHHLSRKLV